MASPTKIDPTDKKILDILQSQGKITNAQLAKDVNLSPAPTLERVKKLETLGYIKGYYAQLNREKLGLGVATFVSIKLKNHNETSNKEFVNHINDIPEVVECHYITGSSDFLIKVVSTSIEAYQALIINKISAIEQIDNLQTMVILSTLKDSKRIPIPDVIVKQQLTK